MYNGRQRCVVTFYDHKRADASLLSICFACGLKLIQKSTKKLKPIKFPYRV